MVGAGFGVVILAGEAALEVEGAEARRVLVGLRAAEGVGLLPAPADLIAGVGDGAEGIEMVGIDVIRLPAYHEGHGDVAEIDGLLDRHPGEIVFTDHAALRVVDKDDAGRRGTVPGLAGALAEAVDPVIGGDAAVEGGGETVAEKKDVAVVI